MADDLNSKRNSSKPRKHRNYNFKKRVPPRTVSDKPEFYVSNKSNFKDQLKKCEKLLSENNSEVVIKAIGAAIERAVNLALQLQQKFENTCEIDLKTGTVSLTDDLEPITEDDDYETQMRQNSSVHIRIYRTLAAVE